MLLISIYFTQKNNKQHLYLRIHLSRCLVRVSVFVWVRSFFLLLLLFLSVCSIHLLSISHFYCVCGSCLAFIKKMFYNDVIKIGFHWFFPCAIFVLRRACFFLRFFMKLLVSRYHDAKRTAAAYLIMRWKKNVFWGVLFWIPYHIIFVRLIWCYFGCHFFFIFLFSVGCLIIW